MQNEEKNAEENVLVEQPDVNIGENLSSSPQNNEPLGDNSVERNQDSAIISSADENLKLNKAKNLKRTRKILSFVGAALGFATLIMMFVPVLEVDYSKVAMYYGGEVATYTGKEIVFGTTKFSSQSLSDALTFNVIAFIAYLLPFEAGVLSFVSAFKDKTVFSIIAAPLYAVGAIVIFLMPYYWTRCANYILIDLVKTFSQNMLPAYYITIVVASLGFLCNLARCFIRNKTTQKATAILNAEELLAKKAKNLKRTRKILSFVGAALGALTFLMIFAPNLTLEWYGYIRNFTAIDLILGKGGEFQMDFGDEFLGFNFIPICAYLLPLVASILSFIAGIKDSAKLNKIAIPIYAAGAVLLFAMPLYWAAFGNHYAKTLAETIYPGMSLALWSATIWSVMGFAICLIRSCIKEEFLVSDSEGAKPLGFMG